MERNPDDWWEEDDDNAPTWFGYGIAVGAAIAGLLAWWII